MAITGVLLAAGSSSRTGEINKLFLKYQDQTLVESALSKLLQSEVDRVLVITGYEESRIAAQLAHFESDRLELIHNPDYKTGRASSIRCAVAKLPITAAAALFMVADKPTISTQLIDRALDQFHAKSPRLLCVRTPSGRGHPIIYSRDCFDNLLALKGDLVGEDLLKEWADSAYWLDDPNEQMNINSMPDYQQLIASETESANER